MTGLKEGKKKKRVIQTQKKKKISKKEKKKYYKYICKVIGKKGNICRKF